MTEETSPEYFLFTANQLVAYNLRQARILRNWTQEDTAERLAVHLGVKWSKASYSAAERSYERPERIRNFTADELVAFSLTFDLPITWFFLPADHDLRGRVPIVATGDPGKKQGLIPGLMVEITFGAPKGQVEQEARLNSILQALPAETQGRYMELVGNVAGLAGIVAMKRVFQDVDLWIENLRDLTGLLEDSRTKTTDDLSRAIRTLASAYYGVSEDDELEVETDERPRP